MGVQTLVDRPHRVIGVEVELVLLGQTRQGWLLHALHYRPLARRRVVAPLHDLNLLCRLHLVVWESVIL